MTIGGITILVVDDDLSVRRALERLLRSAGYRVVTFGSAHELLEHTDTGHADCLVLDVRMPGQSGLDVQQTLADAGRRIPIVFISGDGDAPMAVEARNRGAAEFLAKPVDADMLLAAVAEAIARSGQGQRS